MGITLTSQGALDEAALLISAYTTRLTKTRLTKTMVGPKHGLGQRAGRFYVRVLVERKGEVFRSRNLEVSCLKLPNVGRI